jgi:hypothetical protein
MGDEQGKFIPEVPFGLADLEGIERVVWAYSRYLQKPPATEQNTKRVKTLEKIRGRLAAQLASGTEEVQVLLNVEEIEELLKTMLGFAQLLQRMFPQNEERDSVIESVNAWRLRLIHTLSEFDV